MKNKMMRLIATILILASMVSMFAIFASAETSGDETTEEEEYIPELEVLYNRTFDEGWDHKNGAGDGNVPTGGKPFTFDSEYKADYSFNYFLRFSVESNNNVFLQYEFGNNSTYGSVFEFDIKTDDWTNISNFLHFGTVGGSSSARNNYQVMSIVNNQVYFAKPNSPGDSSANFDGTPTFTLSNSWNHVAIVFDYTYDHDGNPETRELDYFQYSIYYGDTETYRKTGELTLYGTFVGCGKNGAGKGINLFRFNHTIEQYSSNPDTSVCLDNIQCYNYANTYGQVSPESTNKGTKVKLDYPKTVDIQTGDGAANKTKGDYLNECYALKLGVNYAYVGSGYYKLVDKDKERETLRSPILGSDGAAYGAPFMDDDGVIWVALEPILEYCGYPIYLHKDGIFADISTGTSSSFISTQSSTATVDGKRVELLSVPRYYYPNGDESRKYLAMNVYDIATILPEYYVDYDALGLIVISQSDSTAILDRDSDLSSMMDLMKCFLFNYATPEEIYNDVKENTNNFTHPYLHTNQETFDRLRAIFYAEEGDPNYDPEMKDYILRLIWSGYNSLSFYAKLDADGSYLGLMSMDEQLEYFQTPTSVKLDAVKRGEIDTVVINGAECEPYITSDTRTMLDRTDDIIEAIAILEKVMPTVGSYIFGIEKNKPECIAKLAEAFAGNDKVSIATLPSRYPQGGEKVIVYNTTKRVIPEGKLPADVGVIVVNVTSLATLASYIRKGMPLVEKCITVDGSAISNPKNLIAPIGTPIRALIDHIGGFAEAPGKIIFGGPMMGVAASSVDEPILKASNAITVLNVKESVEPPVTACIHCGRCVAACPFGLNPTDFARSLDIKSQEERVARLEDAKLGLCMECGCCSYVCPANRPLVQNNRIGKSEIRVYKAHLASLAKAKEEKK